MSFQSILENMVADCAGAIGAALMGNDGIPIEEVRSGPAAAASHPEEVGIAGVEFGRVLDEIRKASDSLAGGAWVENTVVLSRFSLVLRPVDEDTFLVVAVTPDGNLGKARYLIRRHLEAIRREL